MSASSARAPITSSATVAEPSGPRCPICGNTVFKEHNGRALAGCVRCKSLERGRRLWLALQVLDLLRPGQRVLHFAPERFLARCFEELCGSLYHPCDVDPGRFEAQGISVVPFDICADLRKLPSDCFDLVLHNHVLEHLPCAVAPVLREMMRVTAPGGHMVFTVPFRGEHTEEDLSSDVSPEERRRRFSQADHMRIFGTEDFPSLLRTLFDVADPIFRLEQHFSDEALAAAAIPVVPAGEVDGNTIFHLSKPRPPEPAPERPGDAVSSRSPRAILRSVARTVARLGRRRRLS